MIQKYFGHQKTHKNDFENELSNHNESSGAKATKERLSLMSI